jgi:hypothetical protein
MPKAWGPPKKASRADAAGTKVKNAKRAITEPFQKRDMAAALPSSSGFGN